MVSATDHICDWYNMRTATSDDPVDLSEWDADSILQLLHENICLSSAALRTIPKAVIRQLSPESKRLLEDLYLGEGARPDLGFSWTPIVQAGLPLVKVRGKQHYTRTNGDITVTYTVPDDLNVPHGIAGRQVLTYVITSLVQRPDCLRISFGETPTEFIRSVGGTPMGGRNGNIQQYREQLVNVANLSINVLDKRVDESGMVLNSREPITVGEKNASLINSQGDYVWSEMNINPRFALAISGNTPPFSMSTYAAISVHKDRNLNIPLALDIYTWLSLRNYTLANEPLARISWWQLQQQFGATFRREKFRAQFSSAVKLIQLFWTGLQCRHEDPDAFVLYNSEAELPDRPTLAASL